MARKYLKWKIGKLWDIPILEKLLHLITLLCIVIMLICVVCGLIFLILNRSSNQCFDVIIFKVPPTPTLSSPLFRPQSPPPQLFYSAPRQNVFAVSRQVPQYHSLSVIVTCFKIFFSSFVFSHNLLLLKKMVPFKSYPNMWHCMKPYIAFVIVPWPEDIFNRSKHLGIDCITSFINRNWKNNGTLQILAELFSSKLCIYSPK